MVSAYILVAYWPLLFHSNTGSATKPFNSLRWGISIFLFNINISLNCNSRGIQNEEISSKISVNVENNDPDSIINEEILDKDDIKLDNNTSDDSQEEELVVNNEEVVIHKDCQSKIQKN